jgi:hypothetical protein
MTKRKRTKGQRMIYKTLQRKLKTEQHERSLMPLLQNKVISLCFNTALKRDNSNAKIENIEVGLFNIQKNQIKMTATTKL